MAVLNIYAEKSAFDEITYHGNFPKLKELFINNSEIILNISQQDFDNDINDQQEIFHFLHAYAGAKTPQPYTAPFNNIYSNYIHLLDDPRAIYFLNVANPTANQYRDELGLIVQSSSHINDNDAINFSFVKEFVKGDVFADGGQVGWKHLLKDVTFPPSNSVVISDPYLFDDLEMVGGNYLKVGPSNTVDLLNVILPTTLNTDYHVLIIADGDKISIADRPHFVGNFITLIRGLRPYSIKVEIAFMKSEHIHKRRIILNYINGSADKGFSVFKIANKSMVRSGNDIRLNSVFSSKVFNIGDTEFVTSTKGLKLLKGLLVNLSTHLQNGNPYYAGNIMGDCRADKTIINRLINNV